MNNFLNFLQTLNLSAGEITSCDLNANYLLAVGSSDKKVRVLEWKTGLGYVDMFYSPLSYHKYKITSVRFSPKGTMLVSSSLDGTAVLFEVLTGNKIFIMAQYNTSNIRFCEFSFDSVKLITAAEDGIICFWDLIHQRQIRYCHLHEDDYTLRSLAVSPDSEYLISIDSVDLLKLWYIGDVIDNQPRCILFQRNIHNDNYCCDFSPTKDLIGGFNTKVKYRFATCGSDGTVKLWDLVIEKEKTSPENFNCDLILFYTLTHHISDIYRVRFNSIGDYIMSSGSDNLVKLWEVSTGKCWKTLEGHTGFVTSAAFSKNTILLVTGSVDKSLILWDLSQNLTVDSKLIPPCNVSCHFTHINIMNYGTDKYETNQAKKYKEFILLQKLSLSSIVNCVQFQSDNVLAIAGGDKAVELWKRHETTGEFKQNEILNKSKYSINFLHISPCGTKIIFCSVDSVLMFRDLNTNWTSELKTPNSNGSLRTCKFSPDSKFIAAAGDDQEVYLWDMTNLEYIKIMQSHENAITSLAFTLDSKFLLSACYGSEIILQNVNHEKYSSKMYNAHDLGVMCCDFFPGDKECSDSTSDLDQYKTYLLATGGNDSLVKLWTVTPSEIAILKVLSGHGGTVNDVKFSESKPYILASCSSDTTARIWHVENYQCLHVLNHHKSAVTTCSFSSDSTLFATGSLDKTVLIFNLIERSEKLIFTERNNKLLENLTASDISNWFSEMGCTETAQKIIASQLDGRTLLSIPDDSIADFLELESEEERMGLELKIFCLRKEFDFPPLTVTIKNAPHEFLCPITHQIMIDPVICSDGYAYERESLKEWFLSRKFISPITKEYLPSTKILNYSALKINIHKFLSENEEK